MKLKELMDCSAKAKMLKEALAKDSNKELIEEIARALCYEVWGSYEYVEQFKNQAEAIIPIVEAVKKAEREKVATEFESYIYDNFEGLEFIELAEFINVIKQEVNK